MLFFTSRQALAQQWDSLPAQWRAGLAVHTAPVILPSCSKSALHHALQQNNVSKVCFLGGYDDYLAYPALAQLCHELGFDVLLPLAAGSPLPKSMSSRACVVAGQGRDFILFHNSPIHYRGYWVKGVIDRFLALVLIVASSPLCLLAALLIKCSDVKGGVFFKQQRSGLYGKPFGIWKFRTMFSDAEDRLAELKKSHAYDGHIFKMNDDPRIIPTCKLLRKFSIDELPQLLNILNGEMSLIGPRPLPLAETNAFPLVEQRRRLCVLPGLSCYWQIEGRSNNSDLDIMVQKDGRYIDSWSLWNDASIFLRTIPAVLFCRGAK